MMVNTKENLKMPCNYPFSVTPSFDHEAGSFSAFLIRAGPFESRGSAFDSLQRLTRCKSGRGSKSHGK